MQKIGRIRKMSISPYLDYLKDRLQNEEKGYVRKYIRSKLNKLTKIFPF